VDDHALPRLYSSIAIASYGQPIVSYVNETLKVAQPAVG
jgi:hypothetical protein